MSEQPKELAETRRISVNDFRMWLEGVEEMQAVGWVPDDRQWKRIREKIDAIADAPTAPAHHPSYPPGVRGGPAFIAEPIPAPSTAPVQLAGPSMMPNPSFSTGAPRSSSASPLLATNSQLPVRTPDIDTQGRPYESGFA